MENKQTIYVIGHKNPDTDSICSAIAYADIKNRTEEDTFIPMRAGQINEETEYVLKRFQMSAPVYLEDIGTQVKDMEIHKTEGARSDISVKEAFNHMTENGAVTLPITDDYHRRYRQILYGCLRQYGDCGGENAVPQYCQYTQR